jgi:hypothetical protein
MPHIVLTEDQLRVYHASETTIEIRDDSGRVIGHLEADFRPETREEARLRMRSAGPSLPGGSPQAMLRALEAEWQRTGGFDEEYMRAFLVRWRAEYRSDIDHDDEP